MPEATLHAELRDNAGSQIAKSLRRNGRVPAVYYAHGEDSKALSVDTKELLRLMSAQVNILNLILPDGKEHKCIIKEVQIHPVTSEPVHADIMGIKMTEKIKISIPIILQGTPLGVREGGILEHSLREVEVEGLPLDIPEHLDVDVSEMQIGDVIALTDMPIDKVRFITDEHHPVVHVFLPKVVAVEEEVEEEDLEGEEGEEGAEGTAGATEEAEAEK